MHRSQSNTSTPMEDANEIVDPMDTDCELITDTALRLISEHDGSSEDQRHQYLKLSRKNSTPAAEEKHSKRDPRVTLGVESSTEEGYALVGKAQVNDALLEHSCGSWPEVPPLDPDTDIETLETDLTRSIMASAIEKSLNKSSPTYRVFKCLLEGASSGNSETDAVVDNQHSKDKKFPCSHCDYGTNNISVLERHIQCYHVVDLPFSCPTCYYRTDNRLYLYKHIKERHAVVNPQICSYCSYSTSYISKIKKHLRLKHTNIFDGYQGSP